MDVLLAIDVGNSNTSMGIFAGEQLLDNYRMRTDSHATADEIAACIDRFVTRKRAISPRLRGCVLSSVVPLVLPTMVRAVEMALQLTPLVVGPGIRTGLSIRYEDPREVGADRIANSVAALHVYGPPVIVVDLGTATTLSVLDERGQYLGGVIAPGAMIAAEALFANAARLPQVEMVWPSEVVQRNTVQGMQAGILYGAVAQVDGLVQRIRADYDLPFTVVATGGLSFLLADHLTSIDDVHPYLSLEGLRLLWNRNTKA